MSKNDFKKYIFRKKNASKGSSGHVECNFDNPAEKFFTRRPKTFHFMLENDKKKYIFFKKLIFLKMFQ